MSIPEAAAVVENPSQSGKFQIRNQAILELIYGAGLRVGEVANLNVVHVNLPQCLVHVVRGKGGKDRLVPFGPPAARAIERMLTETNHPGVDALFLNKFGRRLSTRSIWQICHDSGRENRCLWFASSRIQTQLCNPPVEFGCRLAHHSRAAGTQFLGDNSTLYSSKYTALLEAYRQAHPRVGHHDDSDKTSD